MECGGNAPPLSHSREYESGGTASVHSDGADVNARRQVFSPEAAGPSQALARRLPPRREADHRARSAGKESEEVAHPAAVVDRDLEPFLAEQVADGRVQAVGDVLDGEDSGIQDGTAFLVVFRGRCGW